MRQATEDGIAASLFVCWYFTAPPLRNSGLTETWEAMEKLQDQGLVKAIGLSNFSVKKTTDVLNYARIKPAVQQVEIHPYALLSCLDCLHVSASCPASLRAAAPATPGRC